MVKWYAEMGYSALAITNHFQATMLNRTEDDAVDFFMQDFLDAKDEGKKCGLKVCLGIEARFSDLPNDYLIYGVEENDVRQLYRYVGGDSKTYYDECNTDRNFIVQATPSGTTSFILPTGSTELRDSTLTEDTILAFLLP